MITYITTTTILNSRQQFIVNTVNCKGIMGKGLALQVKQRYPAVFARYERYCQADKMKPGEILAVPVSTSCIILNAATKDDWRDPSQLAWIESILKRLRERILDGTITSLALPALGCGNGGLEWNTSVGVLTSIYLDDLTIPVECYIAQGMTEFHIRSDRRR